jgi:hypothetical protein
MKMINTKTEVTAWEWKMTTTMKALKIMTQTIEIIIIFDYIP